MSARTMGARPGVPLALMLFVTMLAVPAAALAHAHYDHSTPAIGEVVPSAPERVDIYTNQEMAKTGNANSIAVTNAAGQRVDSGATIVDDADRRHFWVALQPDLPPGRYVVSFTTLSDVDGDSDHGRFAFYIGRGPTAQEQKLDAQLSGSAPATGSTSSHTGHTGHTGLIIAIAAAAVAVLAAGAGAAVALRRRR
jgi:methionine-rich copper-binding protein CopC